MLAVSPSLSSQGNPSLVFLFFSQDGDERPDEPLAVLPPAFSASDQPSRYLFRGCSGVWDHKAQAPKKAPSFFLSIARSCSFLPLLLPRRRLLIPLCL